jgi:hypothetical protein
VDFGYLLLSAPAQSNIQEEDIMLEPTAMAEQLGGFGKGNTAGAKFNIWLADANYQKKDGREWVPAEFVKRHCVRHSWSKNGTHGYNLLWNKKFIRSLLPDWWPNRPQ